MGPCNVDEHAGGGVDDVEELEETLSVYPAQSDASDASGPRVSRTFMTVAPSLVIVCLPFSSTISRSPP
ncbi:hypothetical protein IMZ48_14550 [Candidatus Bathyarchaeota archaeon]|nr:hypothetical protein [Candidatus Bathyarchaeota archaeon]